jgi:hypothetical protein
VHFDDVVGKAVRKSVVAISSAAAISLGQMTSR